MEYEQKERRYKNFEVLTGHLFIECEKRQRANNHTRVGNRTRCFHEHMHDAVEVLVITSSGTMEVHTKERNFTASHGDIVVFEPYTLHSGYTDYFGEPLDYYVLVFESSLFSQSIAGEFGARLAELRSGRLHLMPHIPADHPDAPKIEALVRQIYSLNHTRSAVSDEARIISLIYELLGHLLENTCTEGGREPSRCDPDFLSIVTDYIRENYASPISTEDICDALSYNKSHFCHKFRECFGCSFITHLNQHRINRAIVMYRGKKMSVSDIAAAVGFNDSCYFTRIFKQCIGMTPSQFFEKQR